MNKIFWPLIKPKKVREVHKKRGYWVGFGDLSPEQINEVKKLNLPDGTYRIKGFSTWVGVWTDSEGKTWTEKTRWFRDFTVAYNCGKMRKEQAIWDCKNSWNIWLIEQKDKKLIFHIKHEQFEYWIYDN